MNIELSPEITQILTEAKRLSTLYNNNEVNSLCLLQSMLTVGPTSLREAIEYCLKGDKSLMQQLTDNLHQELTKNASATTQNKNPEGPFVQFIIDRSAGRILRLTLLESQLFGKSETQSYHLLLAMLRDAQNEAQELLRKVGVNYETVKNFFKTHINTTPSSSQDTSAPIFTPSDLAADNLLISAHSDQEEEEKDTPYLHKYATDLTSLAEQGLLDPIVGREDEMLRVMQILSRRKKNNPILIGQPGVGKSAIVEGLAQLITQHKVPHALLNKRIVNLNMATLVAGAQFRGQFEERIEKIIHELKHHKEYIVFIDEIHTIIGAGGAAGSLDAANIMKPALARGDLQCIGATTIDEYRKTIEKDGALDRRFQSVTVSPTTPKETLHILQNIKERYEEFHHVHYTEQALEACVELTHRYLSDRALPDKAIDALDEAGSRTHVTHDNLPKDIVELQKRIATAQKEKEAALKRKDFIDASDIRDSIKKWEEALSIRTKEWAESEASAPHIVTEQDIAQTISMISGIPIKGITLKENDRLKHLSKKLSQQVIAQDDAIQSLSKAIIRNKLGLKGHQRPIGTFLFVGPTGVGKTYLVKCLAEAMFGSEDHLIRIDMSEYGEKFSTSRLIGAPPGYVGYDEGGQLTEQVRRHPYSVILLDEIEKAHPDVFNTLLQVMDEGRMTDGNGNTIDFRNTIIIMTSNTGTQQLRNFGQGVGFNVATQARQRAEDIIKKALQKQFAPEFLNRLDNIIMFNALNEKDAERIADLEIKQLQQRLADMKIQLTLTPAAKQFVAKEGFSEQYGARALKRAIETHLEDAIAELLINSTAQEGEQLEVKFNVEDGQLKSQLLKHAIKHEIKHKKVEEKS